MTAELLSALTGPSWTLPGPLQAVRRIAIEDRPAWLVRRYCDVTDALRAPFLVAVLAVRVVSCSDNPALTTERAFPLIAPTLVQRGRNGMAEIVPAVEVEGPL